MSGAGMSDTPEPTGKEQDLPRRGFMAKAATATAAVAATPFLTRLQMDNKVKVIHDFRKEIYPGQAVLIRGADMGTPREQVERKFVAALVRGAKTLHEDRALTAPWALEHSSYP